MCVFITKFLYSIHGKVTFKYGNVGKIERNCLKLAGNYMNWQRAHSSGVLSQRDFSKVVKKQENNRSVDVKCTYALIH